MEQIFGRSNASTLPACLNSGTASDLCDFAKAAEDFAAIGIPVIPLGGEDGKIPLVGNLAKYGTKRALAHAERYPFANVGFMCGPKSGITVVDVDETDIGTLHWALNTFGHSPVTVLTGSGKYHLYFRYSGEGRHIFPRQAAGRKIDILGGGLCVAPPSVRPGGRRYEYLWGDLSELANLPPINEGAVEEFLAKQERALASPSIPDMIENGEVFQEGVRNTAMFTLARQAASRASSVEATCEEMRGLNAQFFSPPLTESEVTKHARGAWKLKLQDELWLPGRQYLKLHVSDIKPLLRKGGEKALMLFVKLKMAHGHSQPTFAVAPAAMTKHGVIAGWAKASYRQARDLLLKLGRLTCIRVGGRGPHDPSLYRFAERTIH